MFILVESRLINLDFVKEVGVVSNLLSYDVVAERENGDCVVIATRKKREEAGSVVREIFEAIECGEKAYKVVKCFGSLRSNLDDETLDSIKRLQNG